MTLSSNPRESVTADSKQRVLVSGATGLIGSCLIPQLADSFDIFAVSRTRPPTIGADHWIKHDLSEPRLPRAMPNSVDTVVHLAQSLQFRNFPQAAADIFEVNVGSTARLLDWGSRTGIRRFVYASSGGIYGHGDQGFREDDAFRTPSTLGYYLASKHSGELLVEAYGAEFIVIILRFFFVYGPQQRRSMLIPRLMDAVQMGEPIKLQGRNGIRINPIYVSDAAQAVRAALSLDHGARVNVAGPEVLDMRRIATIIGQRCGREPRFRITNDEATHLIGDISRMTSLLLEPTVPLSVGIERMLVGRDKTTR